MKDGRPEHREIYQGIIERVQRRNELGEFELRTLFSHLIKLPETYKIDFIKVHLLKVLQKADSEHRDEAIFQHYRHYVSISCLASLLSVLRESKFEFGPPILGLLEHIRHLQLLPGPTQKEREQLEHLQYDLIYLLQKLQKIQQQAYSVDISTPEKRRQIAELFYDRMMASFISESEDELIDEPTFVNNLKLEILKSDKVKNFAAKINQSINTDSKAHIKELGLVISQSIQETYFENYKGIFNGSREDVLKLFEEAIKNRSMDAENPEQVELEPITSSVLAVVLELIFNDGFGAFRQTLTHSVFQQLKS
jgi:hypothetical protein